MNTQTTNNQTSEKPAKVRLLDLKPEQFLAVCYTSKKLTDAIDSAIDDAFRDFEFNEMIEPYLRGVGDYSVGLYNQNYIRVYDAEEFLQAVGNHIEMLATSDRVIEVYNHAKELKDKHSNLWRYTVEIDLKNAVLDEINQIADYYEKLGFAVYSKDTTDKNLLEFVENELIGCERYPFDTFILDLTTGEVHDEQPETTVPADQLEEIRKAVAAA